jgi:hypothetical protein
MVTAVFERHPAENAGCLLVALYLADIASDDGRNIHPTVERLASMTRMSVRAAQGHLACMRKSGWLQVVEPSAGPGYAIEYRIDPKWVGGNKRP